MYKCNLVMKTKKFVLIVFFILMNSLIFGQSAVFEREFGNFSNAEAFSITPNEFIYVTDSETNEVYKINFAGEVLKFIGGYGWGSSAFDLPVDVFASTLSVYVTDKNNDRIQFFDKDLNYLSELDSDNLRSDNAFRYPTSAVVSPVGDFFVLDSDNSRILKFDLNGNFTTEIGSYDAGMFSLADPLKFDISSDSRLFVLDGRYIKIFDQFGGGLNKIPIEPGAANIHIRSDILLVIYSNKVLMLDLRNTGLGMRELFFAELYDLKDAVVYKDKLFALTANSILVYKLISRN